jgi:hypothetical protein
MSELTDNRKILCEVASSEISGYMRNIVIKYLVIITLTVYADAHLITDLKLIT